MKPISTQLLNNVLPSRQYFIADAWTLQLGNLGTNVLRYTSGDQSIVGSDGQTYASGVGTGPYFDRRDNKARIQSSTGVEVDSIYIDITPGSATWFGAPIQQAIRYGLLDGAEIILDRYFMPTYGDTRAGPVRKFVGRVAMATFGRSVVTLTCNSHKELLDIMMPQRLFQPGCTNTLGDPNCTVNLPSLAVAMTVSSASISNIAFTANLGAVNGVAALAGAWNFGKVTFTSGVLNGLTRTIHFTGPANAVSFVGYWPAAAASGDTCLVFPGCTRNLFDINGCPKYANQTHFRGYPFVPQPSTIM